MKRRIKKLAGLVLAVVAVGGGCFSCCENKRFVSSRPAIVRNFEGRKEEINKAGREYFKVFLGDYVKDMTPYSGEMRDNINWYNSKGKDGEEEVVRGYFELYDSCLGVAVSHADKEVSDEEYVELGKELVGIHQRMAKKTFLRLGEDVVEKAYVEWGRDKVERNKKIIKSNLDTKCSEFGAMVRNTFSEGGFRKELREQNEAEKILFRGFKDSLSPILRFLGGGILDATHKRSWELNKKEFKRFYGEDFEKQEQGK